MESRNQNKSYLRNFQNESLTSNQSHQQARNGLQDNQQVTTQVGYQSQGPQIQANANPGFITSSQQISQNTQTTPSKFGKYQARSVEEVKYQNSETRGYQPEYNSTSRNLDTNYSNYTSNYNKELGSSHSQLQNDQHQQYEIAAQNRPGYHPPNLFSKFNYSLQNVKNYGEEVTPHYTSLRQNRSVNQQYRHSNEHQIGNIQSHNLMQNYQSSDQQYRGQVGSVQNNSNYHNYDQRLQSTRDEIRAQGADRQQNINQIQFPYSAHMQQSQLSSDVDKDRLKNQTYSRESNVISPQWKSDNFDRTQRAQQQFNNQPSNQSSYNQSSNTQQYGFGQQDQQMMPRSNLNRGSYYNSVRDTILSGNNNSTSNSMNNHLHNNFYIIIP